MDDYLLYRIFPMSETPLLVQAQSLPTLGTVEGSIYRSLSKSSDAPSIIPDRTSSTIKDIERKEILDMPTAAPLVVPALKKHTATVIWAHGLGDR